MLKKLQTYLFSGLVVILPLTLTVYLFVFVVDSADKMLGKYLEPYFYTRFGFYFKGLSIIVGIYLIILVGFIATNYFGRRIHETFERLLMKLPFFRQVYPAIKEIALFFFSMDRMSSFRQVVLVEYPRKGLFSIGFLTSDHSEKFSKATKSDLCHVFISSAPSPLTGFLVLVPKKDITPVDVSIEEAVKLIVSGGVINLPS
jgi:uncharacterized membrane protein